MTYENAHKILSDHQDWRRGLIVKIEHSAAEVNEALEVALAALAGLQSNLNAPDWINAPDWAMFFEIDENGKAFWHEDEPKKTSTGFRPTVGRIQHCGKLILPTLFKRPDL